MNAADVPPVSRSGSSPDPQGVSDSSRRGFRRRRGPAHRGKAAQEPAPPAGGELAAAPTPAAEGEDGHIVDVRA
jgi:hypothetical protein